jgi:hypothetical protein
MLKVVAGMAALFITTGTALAQAQTAMPREPLSPTDWKALTDTRVSIVKSALQLTPEQAKYWPAVEDAIRARAAMREQRSAALRQRIEDQSDFQPIDFLRTRADNLNQRADGLKKLADAWQPLYASLDNDQKRRMRFVAVHVLRDVRENIESRRQSDEDDD